ncbi:MAG: DinB family protein [Pseudoxanthomonas sp.]|nr:DinB family protein [Pseudoxanthomonas sp.]
MTGDARLTLLASYNQWMNQRLYDAAATLPHDALMADRGAFFGSILGTLNHLVVTDTIWLKRFAAAPDASSVLRGLDSTPMPAALDAIPYATLPALHARRTWLDALMVEWVATLAPATLSSRLVYANMKGETFARRIDGLVTHLFNHQTHHRGQVTTLLSQAGVEVGVTDLVTLVPNEG